MKITKARLKQIVKEETKKILTEQPPPGVSPSTFAKDKARARRVSPPRMSRAERDKLVARQQAAKEPGTFVGKPDLAASQAELAAIEDEERKKRDDLYDQTMSYEQDIDYGGDDIPADFTGELTAAEIEAKGGASWEGEEEFGTDHMRATDSPRNIIARYRKDVEESGYREPTADEEAAIKELVPDGTPGGTQKIIALMNPEEPDELADARAAGAALGRKKKSRSRVASGGKLTGRKLNRMRDRGEIDQATWLKARRALANRGQEAARLALGPATGSTGTTDLAAAAAAAAPQVADAAAAAPQVADAAAAAPEQPGLEHVPGMTDPGEADPFNSLSLLKQARAEVLRGAAPSNEKFLTSLNKTYKKRVKVLQRQGASLTDAKYAATDWSLTLLSKKLGVRIARVEAFPETQRMKAKRSRRAAKSRLAAKQFGGGGRDLASIKDQPRSGQPTQTATPELPPVRESRLLAIIKEELQNVLSENEAAGELANKLSLAGLRGLPLPAADAIIAAQGRRPDLADEILAAAMRQAGQKIASVDLVDSLKVIKARPQVAKNPAATPEAPDPRDANAKRTLDKARKRRRSNRSATAVPPTRNK